MMPVPDRFRHLSTSLLAALLLPVLLLSMPLLGCAGSGEQDQVAAESGGSDAAREGSHTTLVADYHNVDLGCGWKPTGSMDLLYARRFTIDYFEGGYQLACLSDGRRYLIVPQDAPVPEGLAEDVIVVQQPVGDIYLVASDSGCLFDALGEVARISVSGIERDDWYVASLREAMDAGDIVYGGKYRSPDYELLLDRGVRLAIESTMINHTPEVREKLEELGIPVIIELSSYEDEPLGRAEWIRFYGALCGADAQASQCFERQVEQVGNLDPDPSGKTVAFFYLNASGAAVVRRPGDYVTTMIEQAGGSYAFDELEAAKAGSSSVTLQMEQFYATAKDADIVIYNASIDDSIDSLDDLLARNELLADFKAVQSGDVWVTEQDMYQQMVSTGDIIRDLNMVFHGATEDQRYLRRLT